MRGDDTRAWGPPYAKYRDESRQGPGESAYYLGVRSIAYLQIPHSVDMDCGTGQPQQEILRTVVSTQVGRGDLAPPCERMRRSRRELPPWKSEEI